LLPGPDWIVRDNSIAAALQLVGFLVTGRILVGEKQKAGALRVIDYICPHFSSKNFKVCHEN
jgi:hypothetical protein